ncbi:MAG: tetratricopeptide repeat protein [Pseudomonadota bacterium]|jgi:tetratricopeptide (TPR) repeat protein|nr:tetratricopeptide repeat protein [Pseudomonadota bacterium]
MSTPQKLFDRARQMHQSGQVREAIELYLKMLRKHPNNPQLLLGLGIAHFQTNQFQKSVESLKRYVVIDPNNAAAQCILGASLIALSRPEDALSSLDRALRIKPDYPEALNSRGTALRELRRPEEARISFENALTLKPDYAEAHNNLGIALCELKRFAEALASYEKALTLNPNYAEAHNNLGTALRALKRHEDALASYEKALALNPNYADAHNNRGIVLCELKRFAEALASYEKALALNPNYAEAHNNLGTALRALKRYDQALASYEKALALNPNYAEAHNNLGVVLGDLNRPDKSLACYRIALNITPDYADAYYNQGLALYNLSHFESALANYNQAVSINPDYAEAHWNKSLLLLLTGNFSEGWPLYDWRLKRTNADRDFGAFSQPSWRGEFDIRGKRLLIQSEQGLGDVVQFCRYVPKLQALGADTILEVPESLIPLISTLQCSINVVAKGAPLPEFDACCPIMSLPYAFNTTLETIPADVPYLFSNESKVREWRHRLGNKDKLRVGLVWSGSEAHQNDNDRSIRLDCLLPLIIASVEWHSLQKLYRAHDIQTLDQHPEIKQHQDLLNDFSDTAALIECLDLVISVDTSVAHVAGAIGKPVWILLHHQPDFRWMLERMDSPWYPTAKLYRKARSEDWQNVINQVLIELRAFIASKSTGCRA